MQAHDEPILIHTVAQFWLNVDSVVDSSGLRPSTSSRMRCQRRNREGKGIHLTQAVSVIMMYMEARQKTQWKKL